MRYAQIDSSNMSYQQVAGWFDSTEFDYPAVDFTLADYVLMTDAQWAARHDTPYYDPAAKTFGAPPPSAPVPLSTLQARAVAAINQSAGQARARYITVEPGQESTYRIKADEADAYVAASRPADTTPYPVLSAEAAARSMTVSALADEVRTTRDAWVQVAAQVEAERMRGKTNVAACSAVDPAAPTAAETQAVTDAQAAAETALAAI